MKIIFYSVISVFFIGIGCKQSPETIADNSLEVKQAERILFIVSNAHFYGDSDIGASNHFSEIVQAYEKFKWDDLSEMVLEQTVTLMSQVHQLREQVCVS